MRPRKGKRLPIPQIEFSYASEAFNLELVAAPDAERIAREKEQAAADRAEAEQRQMALARDDIAHRSYKALAEWKEALAPAIDSEARKVASELTTARGGTFRTYTK